MIKQILAVIWAIVPAKWRAALQGLPKEVWGALASVLVALQAYVQWSGDNGITVPTIFTMAITVLAALIGFQPEEKKDTSNDETFNVPK